MRKRILTAIIAGLFFAGSVMPVLSVAAEPIKVEQARSDYEELKSKVEEINAEIQKIDGQIEPLMIEMNENKSRIETIDNEIDNTNIEIEQCKKDIQGKEEVLGDRLREVYKSGEEVNWLSILFSSNSISDLISNVQSAKRVIELDNKVLDDLDEVKAKLDEKVTSLNDKGLEIKEINTKIETQKEELEKKRSGQVKLIEEAKVKQAEIGRASCRERV